MEVHLIRHTTVKISKKTCYGRLEVPVSDNFENEKNNIKTKLSNDYDIIYSSPSKRCILLARALNLTNVSKDNRLFEIDFGDWEGILWDDINKSELDLWMDKFVTNPPPNGESFNQMFTRVSNFIDMLRNKKVDKVLIITHAGVIRCFFAHLLKFPLENAFKIPIGFNEHFIFKIEKKSIFDSIIKMK